MRSLSPGNQLLLRTVLGLVLLGALAPRVASAANLPPVITTQPSSQVVAVQSNATFTVMVTSLSPLTYQWRKNGTNISGATASSYSITNVQFADQANYSVSLTNSGGSVTSTNATLKVVTPIIAMDNTSSTITNGTTLSWPHTVGSGNNRLLMVGVAIHNAGRDVTSATYGTHPLTFLGEREDSGGKVKVVLYRLLAPPVGTANVTVVINSGDRMSGGAASFTGVSQTAPTGNFAATNGNGTASSITLASADGEVVFDIMGATGDAKTLTSGASQLQLWTNSAGTGSGDVVGGSSREFGEVTNTMIWALGASKPWALAAVSLKPYRNTAPVLNVGTTPALVAVNEDAAAPVGAVGTLVSALVDFAIPAGQVDNVTDPDTNAQLGIAVTAADTVGGAWFYSLNNGTTWNALGAVGNSSARLLAADAGTRIYFQPNANFSGTLADAITFRAWDQSAGNNGTLANTSTNGGTSAFSSATDTASLIVNLVNDSPVANQQAAETPEDTSLNLVVSGSDVDSSVAYAILAGPAHGTLGPLGPSAGTVAYSPATNYNGPDSFTFTVFDGSLYATGSVSITVTPVNDAPVISPLSASTPDGMAKLIVLTGGDVENDPLTFTIVSGPTNGALSGWNATAGSVTYTPNTNFVGDDGFTFLVNDGLTNSAVARVGLSVTAVAPQITVQPQSKFITAGQSAQFSVVATGSGPLSYQWSRNDAPLSGATHATLNLNTVQSADAGDYTVTVANAAGSVPSVAATLSVTNPPSSLSVSGSTGMTSEGFGFQLSVPAGCTYVILASTNCLDWTPIATNVAASADVVFTDPTAASHGARFYRTMVQ